MGAELDSGSAGGRRGLDALTGLPSRAAVQDHLDDVLGRRRARGALVALVLLQIDDRHRVDDDILLSIAHRLRATTRPGDIVARVGDREFAILVSGVASQRDALMIADRIRLTFALPLNVHGLEVAPALRIGVSATSRSAPVVRVETLIRDARGTMSSADGVRGAMPIAGTRDRLRPVRYQPIVTLRTGQVEGFDSDSRAIDDACEQIARWRRLLPQKRDLYVGVTSSIEHVQDPGFAERVRKTLAANALSGQALYLQLSEATLIDGRSSEPLERLRPVGVRLMLDGFGTSTTSLVGLRNVAVDSVQIDESIVLPLEHDDTPEESLVAATVSMTRHLGIRTIATGVASAAQASRLAALGCDAAQGSFYAPPLRAADVPALLCS